MQHELCNNYDHIFGKFYETQGKYLEEQRVQR